MNDETRRSISTSSQPDGDSSLPLETRGYMAELNQGDDTDSVVLVTLHLAAGACLSTTERFIRLFWNWPVL